MRRIIIAIILILMLAPTVAAMEFVAPSAPPDAQQYLPSQTNDFGEGLWYIFKRAVSQIQPEIAEAAGQCAILLTCAVIISIFGSLSEGNAHIIHLVGVLTVGILLLTSSKTLIHLGNETANELTNYGKLLLPVMTAALAAQGGTSSSGALYTGTVIFSTVLMDVITKVVVPLIYIFIVLSIAGNALEEKTISKLKEMVKWLISWILKTILYVFTGYISITGVVAGTVDASALKAAKLTISGAVPVVGGILSDASETILVSAGLMKNSAGIYGILAMLAICVYPFLQTAIQYSLLKITSLATGLLGTEKYSSVISDFSTAMGFVLAMTGSVCLMLLISTVCFMKGIA